MQSIQESQDPSNIVGKPEYNLLDQRRLDRRGHGLTRKDVLMIHGIAWKDGRGPGEHVLASIEPDPNRVMAETHVLIKWRDGSETWETRTSFRKLYPKKIENRYGEKIALADVIIYDAALQNEQKFYYIAGIEEEITNENGFVMGSSDDDHGSIITIASSRPLTKSVKLRREEWAIKKAYYKQRTRRRDRPTFDYSSGSDDDEDSVKSSRHRQRSLSRGSSRASSRASSRSYSSSVTDRSVAELQAKVDEGQRRTDRKFAESTKLVKQLMKQRSPSESSSEEKL